MYHPQKNLRGSKGGKPRKLPCSTSLGAVTVDFEKTPRTEGRHKVQGTVDPMFVAGLPFPVPNLKQFAIQETFFPATECTCCWYRGTSAKTTHLETTLLRTSESCDFSEEHRTFRQEKRAQRLTFGSGDWETGRIRFRGVRFQTPNSVSFFRLTEFRGANSVSSFQPINCVQKRTHRVFGRTHRVRLKTQ